MAGFWSRIKSVFRSILSLFTQRKHPCWPESAAPLPPLGAETEEALARVNWSQWNVLVGSLTTAAQLEYNLQGNYYHVPACYVPEEALPVRYVAIYQSLHLFGDAGGIRWYGEVEAVERMERRKVPLPVNRSNEGELYYVFRIKQWRTLPNPIAIREEWVSEPRFTNFFLLEHAAQSFELFAVQSEQDFRLTKLLCELQENENASAAYRVSENRTLLRNRNGFTVTDPQGKLLEQISLDDFRESPVGGLWRIKRALKRE